MSDTLDHARQTVRLTDLHTCHQVEALLLRDLQSLLSRPRRSTTRDELLGLLKFLEFNLRRQSSLGVAGPNLAATALREPEQHAQLVGLQRQLDRCRERLEEIRIQVLVAPCFSLIAREVRANLRRWLNHVLPPIHRQQQGLLMRDLPTEMGGAA